MVLLTLMVELGAAVAFVAVLTAGGARLRRIMRLPVAPTSRWAVDLVLGAGIVCCWGAGLGWLGWLHPATLIACLAIQGAAGRWRRIHRPRSAVVTAAVAGTPNLIVALGPPHFYDAMVYHLGLPWQAWISGGWSAHPENVFAAFPPLAQMVNLPALGLGLNRTPALLHWWAWVCAAAAVSGLAARLGAGRRMSLLVSAAVMLLPVSPLIPGFPAAEGWFLAAVIPAVGISVLDRHRAATLPVLGLLLGLAVAARVQGLAWAAILILFRATTRPTLGTAAKAAGLLVLGAAPWWFKNLVFLGDPTAPVFWDREGLDTLWRDGGALLKAGRLSPAVIPSVIARLTPAVIPTFVAAALAALSNRRAQWLFMAGVLGSAAWIATGTLPRFFVPTFVVLLVATAAWTGKPLYRKAALCVISLNLVLGLFVQIRWMGLIGPFHIISRNWVEAAPLVAPNPPFEAYVRLDAELPPDARILTVAEPRIFGIPRPVIAPSQHDPSPMRPLCEGTMSPVEFSSELAGRGFTHIIINDEELSRLGRDYPVTPWKTARGHARWQTWIRSLGPPLDQGDGIRTYSIPR